MPRAFINEQNFELAAEVAPYLVPVIGESFRLSGTQRRIDNSKVNRHVQRALPLGVGWARMDRETGRGVGGALDSTIESRFRALENAILHESQTHAASADHPKKFVHFKGDFWALFEGDYSSARTNLLSIAQFGGTSDDWLVTPRLPQFNAASSGGAGSAASLTVAHTVQSTHSNRIVLAVVYCTRATNTDPPTGVTYDGAAMTQAAHVQYSASLSLSIWYRVNPSTGSNNCVASFGHTELEITMAVLDYFGVDQTTPIGTAVTDSTSGTSESVSPAGDRGFLNVGGFANDGGRAVTEGAGQTQRAEVTESNSTLSVSDEYNDGSDPAFSCTVGGSETLSLAVVPLRAPGIISYSTTSGQGIRGFDMTTHKGRMVVIGSKGESAETQYEWYYSSDGSDWRIGAGTSWPTGTLLTTTLTRRNNFDDDEARVLDFGNTLMMALHDNTNSEIEVWYTVNNGGAWTAGAVIPSGSGPKKFCRWKDPFTSPPVDSPTLVTAEGVYRVDSGGATFDLIYELDGDPNNGRWAAVGQDGDLYVGLGNGDLIALHAVSGGIERRKVGPPGDGFVSARQGHVNFILAPALEWLFVAYGGHSADHNASIWAIEYQQKIEPETGKVFQAWHHIYQEGDANIDLYLLGYSTEDDATPRLHFALENASSAEMFHLERPDVSRAATGVTIKRQASSILRLPVDDLGDPQVNDAILQVLADVDDLFGVVSPDEYIKIQDGLDGDADTTNARGNFDGSNTVVSYGTSGRGVSGKKVGTRLTFYRRAGDNTKSPALYEFEMQTRPKVETLMGFRLSIDIAATARLINQPAKVVVSRIKTIIESVTLVPLLFESTYSEFEVEAVDISPALWQLVQASPADNVGDVLGGTYTLDLQEVL